MTSDNPQTGCGWIVAGVMIGMFILSLIIVLAWNVGLYGAGISHHKIDFWTALGLAFVVMVLRSIFATARRGT